MSAPTRYGFDGADLVKRADGGFVNYVAYAILATALREAEAERDAMTAELSGLPFTDGLTWAQQIKALRMTISALDKRVLDAEAKLAAAGARVKEVEAQL